MDPASGHAHMCCTRRHISSYDGAGADGRRISDSDTGKYIRASTDENARSNSYVSGKGRTRRQVTEATNNAFVINNCTVIDDAASPDYGGGSNDGTSGNKCPTSDARASRN